MLAAMHFAYDAHGHLAETLAQRKLIGRYYWPTRFKDVTRYCCSCSNCQFNVRQQRSSILRPLHILMPFDMLGIDYIGKITSKSGDNLYIVVIVNYFSRYVWTLAVPANDGANALTLLEEIVKVFGLPRAVYSDNGSHFVQGVLAAYLKARGVRHYPAPKSHPSSVGLSERYVQLVLHALRKMMF